MKYEYKDPYNGIQSFKCFPGEITEASAEVIKYLEESRRQIENADRRERYHAPYHIEANVYEGEEYADLCTAEDSIVAFEENEHLYGCLQMLTDTQRRRFMRYAEGDTLDSIASDENVSIASVKESIDSARNKLKKFL